jgi:hypothetical protein
LYYINAIEALDNAKIIQWVGHESLNLFSDCLACGCHGFGCDDEIIGLS